MRWIACSALLLLPSSPPAFPTVEEEKAPAGLEIGSPAPDFDLPGVDGKRHALRDFAAAKALVVLFTCNHCPTAQAYEERAKKLDALAEALEKGWSGALPFTLLVKPGGKIVYRHEGQIDPLELRRAIVDVLGRTY